jgi:hypothetical protein
MEEARRRFIMRFVGIAKKEDGTIAYAKENCKKCYGRGYVGFSRPVKNSESNVKIGPVMCGCVFAVPIKMIDDCKKNSKMIV